MGTVWSLSRWGTLSGPSDRFAALLRSDYRGASDALRARRLAPPEGGGHGCSHRFHPLAVGPAALKGEDMVVLTVFILQGVVPTSPVRLDQVVRSVSVSEQSDESGTDLSIRRPPSPPNPRPDSRPGIRHQPSNSANHCPTASGPHRGSRGTYGVVPRPEGPGEDGVLPGKQGVSGGRSPPLMHEQSARSQPQPRTRCSVGGVDDLCGLETPSGGGPFTKGPPPTASRPPPPEGGGHGCSHRSYLSVGWGPRP